MGYHLGKDAGGHLTKTAGGHLEKCPVCPENAECGVCPSTKTVVVSGSSCAAANQTYNLVQTGPCVWVGAGTDGWSAELRCGSGVSWCVLYLKLPDSGLHCSGSYDACPPNGVYPYSVGSCTGATVTVS